MSYLKNISCLNLEKKNPTHSIFGGSSHCCPTSATVVYSIDNNVAELNDNSPCNSTEQIHIPEASLLGCYTLIKKCPSNFFEQFIFSSIMTAASMKYIVHLFIFSLFHLLNTFQSNACSNNLLSILIV